MILSPDIFYLVLLYWFLYVTYSGWGRLACHIFDINLTDKQDCFSIAWVGWSVSLVLLQTIHLLYPLGNLANIALFASGIVLYVYYAKIRSEKVAAGKFGWPFMVFIFLGSCWVASHALSAPYSYDSGLYHFNSIRWLNEYAIVPGLGNLHSRLAFNMSFFGYAASLNVFPPFYLSHNLANSFLLLLLAADCIYALFHYGKISFFERIVKVGCVPLVVVYGMDIYLSSPQPDIGSVFLRVIIFFNLLVILGKIKNRKSPSSHLKVVILLAFTAITVKLSSAMYSAVLIVLCSFLYLVINHRYSASEKDRKSAFILFLTFAAIIWIARGLLLSGCPVYPSKALCIDVDWAVPENVILKELNSVKGTRAPGTKTTEYIGTWKWIPKWIKRMNTRKGAFVYPFVLAAFATLAGIFTIVRSCTRKGNVQDFIFLFPMVPLIASLIFLFIMSPVLRFAQPFLYLLTFAGFLPLFSILRNGNLVSRALIYFIIFTINLPLLISLYNYRPEISFNLNSILEPPYKGQLRTIKTLEGVEILTPVEGDQCWDSSIPATPHPNVNLKLRKGSIQSGFSVK